jgi:hypothetical protein
MAIDHTKDDCQQEVRLARLELTIDGLIKQLAEIHLSLGRIEVTLTNKVSIYDKHVDSGEVWRADILKFIIGMIISIGMLGVWVGGLANQIRVNTDRLAVIENDRHPSGIVK